MRDWLPGGEVYGTGRGNFDSVREIDRLQAAVLEAVAASGAVAVSDDAAAWGGCCNCWGNGCFPMADL